ncbi:MAG: hypothetical protein AB1668_03195 [Nanoarchaeota archaeon]
MFSKKGQLGIIEFKYFMAGLFFGLIAGFVLILLGTKKVLPFQIPVVCGSIFSSSFSRARKGQLGAIEFHYFIAGFFIGLILALVLVYLGTAGVLPFQIPLVCSA